MWSETLAMTGNTRELGPMFLSVLLPVQCIVVVLDGKTGDALSAAGWEDMECGTVEYDSACLVVVGIGVWLFSAIVCDGPLGLYSGYAGAVDVGCEDSWSLMYFLNEQSTITT